MPLRIWPNRLAAASIAARLFGPILVRLPLIYVGGSGKRNKSGRGYFITKSALVTMLKKYRCDIAKVEILRMGGEKRGRHLAIVRKRRIGHLFIVMGTNAVGKSTFVESLLRGENSDVANEMGLDLSLDWTHQRYNKLPQAETADVPHMLLQFNIGKYLIDGDLHHYERGLLDLIRVADKVTIATMWLPAETLRERFAKRVPASWLKKRMRSRRVRKIHKTFAQLYADPDQLALRYRAWFSFARRNSRDNFVVLQDSRPNPKNSYRVVTIEDWEREQP